MDLVNRAVAWLEGVDWQIAGLGVRSSGTLGDLVLALLVSFVCGQLVAWTYARTHRGLSYSRGFVQSLILVAMIVALVMGVVGDSLARAFGLVGALAIIRFRTAVRDTRDIAFVFLALGSGIAAGSGHAIGALVATPVICLVSLWLTATGFGARYDVDAFLRLRLPAGSEPKPLLERILAKYCHAYAHVGVASVPEDDGREHSFQLQLLDKDLFDPLMRELDAVPGASGIDLMVQDAEGGA